MFSVTFSKCGEMFIRCTLKSVHIFRILCALATKVASDAWKLMGPEEKVKYSTRARDVWDKYLSRLNSPLPLLEGFLYMMMELATLRMFDVLNFLCSTLWIFS
uniref:Uncharacterized protein n=1 Tax=Solanum lycopersicum TaxID=4081 RepID=A0A494G9L8_SOLLC